MKFEIDTKNKTITLKERVNISLFVEEIKNLLDTDWENYEIIVDEYTKVINIPHVTPYTPINPNIDPNDPYKITC